MKSQNEYAQFKQRAIQQRQQQHQKQYKVNIQESVTQGHISSSKLPFFKETQPPRLQFPSVVSKQRVSNVPTFKYNRKFHIEYVDPIFSSRQNNNNYDNYELNAILNNNNTNANVENYKSAENLNNDNNNNNDKTNNNNNATFNNHEHGMLAYDYDDDCDSHYNDNNEYSQGNDNNYTFNDTSDSINDNQEEFFEHVTDNHYNSNNNEEFQNLSSNDKNSSKEVFETKEIFVIKKNS